MNRYLLTLALCVPLVLFAQKKKKIKFGTVTMEEMQMTSYELDSTASAVVLYDKGEFRANGFKFFRHQRIKVLKNSGTGYGNIVLGLPSKSLFKAFVYNLEDGEIVETKLESESIYEEERLEGDFVYKVYLPNVKVGSVIDLQYSHFGIPYEWRFQNLIPTKHSELWIEDSDFLSYSKIQKGFEPIEEIKTDHWVAKDVPAFNEEPHITHFSNYITKFEFQITAWTYPGRYSRGFSTSWEVIGERLLDSDRFGSVIRASYFVTEKAKEIRESGMSVEEQIKAAYDYVTENIKWNNYHGLFAGPLYRENFRKHHSGSVAEINLILVALLKKMDLIAYPVLASTRNNGIMTPIHPSLWRVNYVLAYVEHEGRGIIMDASMPDLVPGFLPEKILNGQGWAVIDRTKGKWVDLYPKKSSEIKQYVQIKLDEYGEHSAVVSQSRTGYRYLDWLKEYRASDSEENYSRKLEGDHEGLSMVGYSVSKNDPLKLSASEKMEVDLFDYVDDLGNELILDPYLMNTMVENPFKAETRSYPVDMIYPQKNSASITIALPETFVVNKLPESLSLKTPDGGASFLFQCQQTGSNVQISYRINFKKTIFLETEYMALKDFYSRVINKLSESIQITKKT